MGRSPFKPRLVFVPPAQPMSIFILSSFCSAESVGKFPFPAALQGILVFFCGKPAIPPSIAGFLLSAHRRSHTLEPLPFPIQSKTARPKTALLYCFAFLPARRNRQSAFAFKASFTLAKSERISSSGSLVSRETTTITMQETRNAGSSS